MFKNEDRLILNFQFSILKVLASAPDVPGIVSGIGYRDITRCGATVAKKTIRAIGGRQKNTSLHIQHVDGCRRSNICCLFHNLIYLSILHYTFNITSYLMKTFLPLMMFTPF